MSTKNRKGVSSIAAIIVASFFSAAIVSGFAISIYQGTLGNADPARGELSDMLDNVNDSCAQGISNVDDFEPGEDRTSENKEVEVCPQDEKALCYGDTQAEADYLVCEGLRIDCTIRRGTRYNYESKDGEGVIKCE